MHPIELFIKKFSEELTLETSINKIEQRIRTVRSTTQGECITIPLH